MSWQLQQPWQWQWPWRKQQLKQQWQWPWPLRVLLSWQPRVQLMSPRHGPAGKHAQQKRRKRLHRRYAATHRCEDGERYVRQTTDGGRDRERGGEWGSLGPRWG